MSWLVIYWKPTQIEIETGERRSATCLHHRKALTRQIGTHCQGHYAVVMKMGFSLETVHTEFGYRTPMDLV